MKKWPIVSLPQLENFGGLADDLMIYVFTDDVMLRDQVGTLSISTSHRGDQIAKPTGIVSIATLLLERNGRLTDLYIRNG